MSATAPMFELAGVVHLVRPVGETVGDLEALRTALERVPERSLFFHTAGRFLRHPADDELPLDDLSAWVNGVVQDRETAERMSFAIESCPLPATAVRGALIAVLDTIPAKQRTAHDAPPGGHFVFLTADSVPVPTGKQAGDASQLIEQLAVADPSVWFYHLIEEPWFAADGGLVAWLRSVGGERLAEGLERVARSGQPLEMMRRRALRRWYMSGLGRRLAAAALDTDLERREAGREAIAKLARRLPRPGEPT